MIKGVDQMKEKRILRSLGILLLTTICILLISTSALALPQSKNVAIIGSPRVVNGGYLPTDSGITGLGITFTNLAPADVNAANLAAFDTVVINVASSEMRETTSTLTAQAKADLVAFVGNGGKMIIYDSECPSADYSWLPYPFTTNNPGAMGAHGTLTIVEENTLSTSDPSTQYYIDVSYLGGSTDAVGDMNVMVTKDPYWCIDMSGTNINHVTGPVHTYADYSIGGNAGLFIYNGLDIDYMGMESNPNGLRKIWIQELMQPFNPSDLPGSVTVVGINLVPITDQSEVGTEHTVTATITDQLGNPQAGINVNFEVVSGPNAGDSGSATTDSAGKATFTYMGDGGEGTDMIKASFVNNAGTTIESQAVTKEWTKPANLPPVANAGQDQVVEQTNYDSTPVTLDGSGSNDDGIISPLTYDWTWNGGSASGVCPTVTLPSGTTTVALTVSDGEFSSTDTVDIKVQDTTAPTIAASDKPKVFWPPNHKYQTVSISDFVSSVTDTCDPSVDISKVVITSVSSDELEDAEGDGDGKTLEDIVIKSSQTVDLRAERQGAGNGRVYTINYQVADAAGNVATGFSQVWCPHDQDTGATAVDNGAAAGYTVTY